MADEAAWNCFFSSFRRGLDDQFSSVDRLHRFFERFRHLYAEQKSADAHQPMPTQISANDFEWFLATLKPAIREHYSNGFAVNVWDVAGVKSDEVRISSILAWLLDCNGSHGQGNIFLEGLLTWLAENKGIPQQARENLPMPGCTQGLQYRTRTESLPLGEKESRVDIEISGPFVLIIEVKIYATENGDQLKRYLEIAKKKAISKKWGVLYLTRHGMLPIDKSLHTSICPISWKQMISIINNVNYESVKKRSFIHHQINQFCYYIKSL